MLKNRDEKWGKKNIFELPLKLTQNYGSNKIMEERNKNVLLEINNQYERWNHLLVEPVKGFTTYKTDLKLFQ